MKRSSYAELSSSRLWLCLVTLVALHALPPLAIQGQESSSRAPRGRFEERLEVSLVSVPIEFPELSTAEIASLEVDDLLVEESGSRRKVVDLVPLSGSSEPWTVLIYVDDILSHPRTLELTLRALAKRASVLVALGPVTVLRSSASGSVLEASVSIAEVTDRLERLARAGLGQDALARLRFGDSRERLRDSVAPPATEPSPRPFDLERNLLRSAVDRTLLAGTRCEDPPCLMIWVSDGFDSTAAHREPGAVASVASSGLASVLARGLAASGWTVIGAALRDPLPPLVIAPEGSGTDYDAWKRDSGGVQMEKRNRATTRVDRSGPETQEMWILPRFEPHRELLATTAGGLARLDWQLGEELERLSRRWWLLYERPSSWIGSRSVLASDSGAGLEPEDLATLHVRFATGGEFARKRRLAVRLGVEEPVETIRAPAVVRVGDRAVVACALLRQFAEGGDAALSHVGSEVERRNRIDLNVAGQGLDRHVRWRLEPSEPSSDQRARSEIRVRTFTLLPQGRVAIGSRSVGADGGEPRVPIEPPGSRALLLEELAPDGAVVRFGLIALEPEP